ncbi:major facilitator superfamily domain-containing protein [Colletotrichum cereale]|nr:major facilitator superfamily domain-containing protein [Colletotrichum cereale]
MGLEPKTPDAEAPVPALLSTEQPKSNDNAIPATADAEAAQEQYPEGGPRAWLVVLGCWLVLFSSSGIMNSLGVFSTYIGSHQLAKYEAGSVGWIFSVYTFLCFACGVYVGPLFDKYGPRPLILAGSTCHVGSLMLFSVCTGKSCAFQLFSPDSFRCRGCFSLTIVEYWHFMLTFGVLNGIGTSLLFNPSIATVGHWFYHRRGLATGIATTGGVFGGIAFPLSINALIETAGWPWAIRYVAFICLFCCAISLPLVRARLPPAQDAKRRPDFRILTEPAFALTTLSIFLLFFAGFIPLTYVPAYMLKEGFSSDFSFEILPIFNAASAVGRVIAGYWGDRIGVFNSNIAATALSAFAALAIWLPFGSSMAGILSFVVIFGLANGNTTSISPVCIGKLCKTQSYGRYYATAYTIASIGSLVGIPIGGEVLTATQGEYWGMILLTGLVYAVSLLTLCAAKAVCVGPKIWARF